MDVYEFEAGLVYRASSRTFRATQRDLVSKQNTHTHMQRQRKKLCMVSGGGCPTVRLWRSGTQSSDLRASTFPTELSHQPLVI